MPVVASKHLTPSRTRRAASPRHSAVKPVADLVSPLDKINQIKQGLGAHILQALSDASGLPVSSIGELASIPRSTYSRKIAEGARLSPEHSERALRVHTVFNRALALLNGDQATLRSWLAAPIPALMGKRPNELLDTGEGERLVLTVLDQIESGAYA